MSTLPPLMTHNEEVSIDDQGLPEPSPYRLLREPRRPHRIRTSTAAPWLAVTAVCFGAMMSQLDSSIVTLAYPTLQHHFNVSIGAVSWVGLAYILTSVSTLVLFGRISDMIGRKLIYTYGFMLFLVGSVACGLSPSLTVLVVSRIIQAIGGAMLQANSVAIVVLAVAKKNRTKALGFQATAQAAGLALGPTIGGLILGVVSWRWLFLVNIPLGLIGMPLAFLFIPRSRHLAERERLDVSGAMYLLVAVAALLASLSFASDLGWGSPMILVGFAVFVFAVLLFFRQERTTSSPLISPLLLSLKGFRWGLGGSLLSYLSMFSLLFLVPFELERGLGKSTSFAGLSLFALPLAIVFAAPFASRFSRKVGTTRALVTSSAIAAFGVAIIACGQLSSAVVIAGLAVAGVGFGLYNTTNNSSIMGKVAVNETGVGSGMLNMSRGIGTALGVAAAGALFVALGGDSLTSTTVRASFSTTAWVVAAVCCLAGLFGAWGVSSNESP